jgi:uncharacterized lipoprotein YajG
LSEDRKDLITVISVVVIIFAIFILSACSSNSRSISPKDTLYIDFMVITDQDSLQHWYERTTTQGGILVGENYCYRHHNWEDVRKKSE